MPQRTNEFQELVSLIRKSLAREGDTVEDSAMVKVQGLETEREIDVLHKTSDGFTTIKISVEAKDEGRKIDLTALGRLCAKYRGEGRVCVDKFIVVSRNGFTEGAIEKARLLDVPLLTLDEAKASRSNNLPDSRHVTSRRRERRNVPSLAPPACDTVASSFDLFLHGS